MFPYVVAGGKCSIVDTVSQAHYITHGLIEILSSYQRNLHACVCRLPQEILDCIKGEISSMMKPEQPYRKGVCLVKHGMKRIHDRGVTAAV